jgi:hypothetical protein
LSPLEGHCFSRSSAYQWVWNQKFWWRIPERKILISGYPKDL